MGIKQSNLKSDEEVIAAVQEVWDNHKMVTRNLIRNITNVSDQRLKEMSQKGLIDYPAKVGKGHCAIYKKNDTWRNFQLPGSPTSGRKA